MIDVRKYQRQWKLEELRELNGDTQEQMANLLNINTTSFRNKEKGDTEFKATEMFIIAKHYGKTLEEIFLPPKFTFSELEKQKA